MAHAPFAAALLLAALFAATTPVKADDLVIHAGRLIDGTGGAPKTSVSIRVRDDRIVSIEDGYAAVPGARVVDLRNKTVLPGLIDTHVHLTFATAAGGPMLAKVTRTASDQALTAAANAKLTLEAGFTSVRDLGGDAEAVIAVKRAIQGGVTPGPRLWVSGPPLGPTGGAGDNGNGFASEVFHPHWDEALVDSPEAGVKAVRRLRKQGVDLIKITPSGGVMSENTDPNLQVMTDAEIEAVVEASKSLGIKVAAHAHAKSAIDAAVRAGVSSIEHGTFADAESHELMKRNGVYLVPTLLVAKTIAETVETHPERFNPSTLQKARSVPPLMYAALARAHRAGVKIAFGTDMIGFIPHGLNAREFKLMTDAGLSPMDAIVAATKNAADLIGSRDIGTVEAGRYADIIAVDADPLADVSRLETVTFVMKGGAVVVWRSNLDGPAQ